MIAPFMAVPARRLNPSPTVAVWPRDPPGASSFNRPYGTAGPRGRRRSQVKASLRDAVVSNVAWFLTAEITKNAKKHLSCLFFVFTHPRMCSLWLDVCYIWNSHMGRRAPSPKLTWLAAHDELPLSVSV